MVALVPKQTSSYNIPASAGVSRTISRYGEAALPLVIGTHLRIWDVLNSSAGKCIIQTSLDLVGTYI